MKKIPGNFTEFCQSEKVGTLGPAHGIVTKTVHKTLPGGGGYKVTGGGGGSI